MEVGEIHKRMGFQVLRTFQKQRGKAPVTDDCEMILSRMILIDLGNHCDGGRRLQSMKLDGIS